MSDDEPQEAAVGTDAEPSRNVIDYFGDRLARFFAILGSIAFIGGWAGVIYIAFSSDFGNASISNATYRIQVLVTHGASVTMAASILWGVAAYIWVHLLPGISE